MARIWYSVMGEGFGHALRSDVVLSRLVERHEVVITATDKAYEYLAPRYGDRVRRIEGGRFIYEDNEVKVAQTVLKNARLIPRIAAKNIPFLNRLVDEFRPDVLVSDFEASSLAVARARGLPAIGLDNIHALTELEFTPPRALRREFLLASAFIKGVYARADRRIITAFAEHRPRDPSRTFLAKPVVQADVERLSPRTGRYVLVYQTSPSNVKMIPVLAASGLPCRVYGMGEREPVGNVTFRGFSRKGFLRDLSGASFVIVNGGFTVISEALYLRKPVLAIPIRNQAEQFYNAWCLEEMGYGAYTSELRADDLERFKAALPGMRHRLSRLRPWSQKPLIALLERLIADAARSARSPPGPRRRG